ncbi:hypothetical protein HMI55_005191 [Coelomomyces lativittatus]|nr:hypothetical protein HMI55_005191 [Coelomomyces lativittatus]
MDLSSCKTVDDDVLKLLTRDWAQHIEVINFQNSFAITDAGLIPLLGNCTKLRILNLKNCWNVLLANVPDSISIPTLISLNLDNVRKLTNKSLQYCFQSFPSLMKLSLSYCKLIDDIQGPCWPRLQSLNLHRCTNITQEAFTKCLSQGPDEWQLRNFNLADHHGLLDATLQLFASKTPWLTSLNLSFCSSITPACISSLRKWDLIVLDVSYCLLLVNDEVLEHFSAFPSLKGLGLRGCSSITDNGLSHLFKLETLKTINISQCPKLSPTIHEKAKMSWKCLTTQSIFEIDYSTA